MARRPRSRLELRAEIEAAEARGLIPKDAKARSRPSGSVPEPEPDRPSGRLKVVWQVCNLAGRPVATYDYAQREQAEAHAAQLKSKTRENHFVRSAKVPIVPLED